MPPEDYIDIKYEDFCKDPEGYVKQIYDHLGIDGFEEAKPYFDAYLESQKNYQKNKFELTPELRDKINAKLGFYFEHYGYEMQKIRTLDRVFVIKDILFIIMYPGNF